MNRYSLAGLATCIFLSIPYIANAYHLEYSDEPDLNTSNLLYYQYHRWNDGTYKYEEGMGDSFQAHANGTFRVDTGDSASSITTMVLDTNIIFRSDVTDNFSGYLPFNFDVSMSVADEESIIYENSNNYLINYIVGSSTTIDLTWKPSFSLTPNNTYNFYFEGWVSYNDFDVNTILPRNEFGAIDLFVYQETNASFLHAPAPTPEPATMLLFGTGLAGLAAIGRRKIN